MIRRRRLLAQVMLAGPWVAPALLAGCAASAPATRSTVAAAAAFDRAVPPTLGGPPSLTMPPVVQRELPNGLMLLVVEQHELPLADFLLLVRSGAEADPPAKSGLATLAADVLDEGTTTRESLAIADQQAYLGVQLQSASGWDASTISLHTPTAQLDSALALFADVALHPTFPEREFARLRTQRITGLIQLKDRPPAIADRAYASILFGDEHPYGHSLAGTEASVATITRDDVLRFYRTYVRPNNATLLVVGDVRPADIERRVRALFGSWERAEVPTTRYAETQPPTTTTVYLIDKPGAPQSSIRIGTIGVPRSTEDYFAIQVMNTVLGGAFTSRLNQNLRETHGYTYGAGSGFSMRRAAGPFTARAEVTGTKTDSALVEFIKELRAIRDPVPAAELEKAKRYLQLQLPSDFESSGDIAGQLVPIVLYGLPLDYYNSYVQRIGSVGQADVQRVATKYVDPTRFAIVVVGDRASIEPGLRALNVGTVQIRDISGQPIRP